MDRLTATRVFVTVADCGSLTQAADKLDMSTAMVSRYLAAIETWLGARLLHRTTRRVSLSQAGHQALVNARQMLELADELQHQAGEVTRVPSGRLTLTCAASFAESQLAPALVAFQQAHPQVSVSLLATDKSVDLAADRIDLALRITNHLEPTLIARRLATCRSAVCASPRYLAQHREPSCLADLAEHRCLTHARLGPAQFQLRSASGVAEGPPVPITEVFSANETAVLARAIREGAGIGILPTYLVGDDLRAGRLRRVLPDWEPEAFGIHAVLLSRRHQPLALRLLVDFLAEQFGGELAPWEA